MAYGSLQARGQRGATVATYNTAIAMRHPEPTEGGKGLNLHPHGC